MKEEFMEDKVGTLMTAKDFKFEELDTLEPRSKMASRGSLFTWTTTTGSNPVLVHLQEGVLLCGELTLGFLLWGVGASSDGLSFGIFFS